MNDGTVTALALVTFFGATLKDGAGAHCIENEKMGTPHKMCQDSPSLCRNYLE